MRDATFFAWLGRQRHRSDPVGDLARDAVNDVAFPRGSPSFDYLELHLDRRGACAEAFDALNDAYDEWGQQR